MDLLYKINALVVGRIKNVKFEHDFCTNNWFFIAQIIHSAHDLAYETTASNAYLNSSLRI